MTPNTFSEDYRSEQQRLHSNPRYGRASVGYAALVASLLSGGHCKSLSDYGAGKCRLRDTLGAALSGIDYFPYDPAFPDYGAPRPADLVACIDVLEHVEPELLNNCVDELASITTQLALVTVHTGPAKKTLSDGRNAHLTQEPAEWWLAIFADRFDVLLSRRVRKGLVAILCPRGSRASVQAAIDLPAIARAVAQCNPRRSAPAILWTRARREVATLWLAARDPRTPVRVKLVIAAVLALALSPTDLTPDIVPGVGHADDFILWFIGSILAVQLIPDSLLLDLRERAREMSNRAVSTGAAMVVLIWMTAAIALLLRHPHA
jgi:uncharacterized membrane protein YkvA (DUF1232 family)